MPNPRFSDFSKEDRTDKGMPPKMKPGHRPDATPMKTANWAGLPGKTQPGTRDKSGTKKLHQGPKEEGI